MRALNLYIRRLYVLGHALGVIPTDVVNAADGRPVTERAVEPVSIVGPNPRWEGARTGGG